MFIVASWKIWTPIIFLLVAQLCEAQITIQESDMQKVFTPNARIRLYHDTSTVVSVGDSGGPNIYDFSSLAFPDSSVDTVYKSSGIPSLASRFDTASFVWSTSRDTINGGSIFLLNQSGFINVGEITIFDSLLDIKHDNPPEETVEFPATYRLTWSTSPPGAGVDSTFINGIFTNLSTGWNSAEDYTVDGYGTLIVKGHSYQCLRIRSEEESTYTSKSFNFFTNDGIVVTVESYKTQNDTGEVTVRDLNYLVGETVTSVNSSPAKPTSFELAQNYPNPFNPSTVINYQLPTDGHVTLKVFDILGREVRTLVNEVKNAGSYEIKFDASSLASGIYFYRLNIIGNDGKIFVSTKKMLLMK